VRSAARGTRPPDGCSSPGLRPGSPGFPSAPGLSQEELAHASDLTRNYVWDLELGKKSPSLRTILQLARALGIRPSELVRAAEAGAPDHL
jgi:DNA-binding XRE family transcriptional regulator